MFKGTDANTHSDMADYFKLMIGDPLPKQFGKGSAACQICTGADNQKFLSTPTTRHICLSRRICQHLGDFFQYLVPDRMTVTIIDLLKMIYVYDHDGTGSPVTIEFIPFVEKDFIECDSITDLSQGIRLGNLLKVTDVT